MSCRLKVSPRRSNAFTLAELLIALTILAEIVTFTIPKVLLAKQNETFNTAALDGASTVAAAFQIYQSRNGIASSTGIKDLTPFMNYLSVDNSTIIDDYYGASTITCGTGGGGQCLRLYNGSMLEYWAGDSFGGTNTTNAIPFRIDPDSRVTDGTTNGPGKTISFMIYTNGRIVDRGNIVPNTAYSSYSGLMPTPGIVPPWFHWN